MTDNNNTPILITDLCIIGAGASGLSLARNAKQCGLDVILIEQNKTGGTYLHQGCIIAQTLKACAQNANAIRTSEQFAIRPKEPQLDIQDIHEHIQNTIKHIEPHDSSERLEGFGIRVIKAQARFNSPKELMIENAQLDTAIIRAKNYVIATGAHYEETKIAGLDENKSLQNINLKERPNELIILGGSPHAIEVAQSYQRLGISITLIEANHILPNFDQDAVTIIRDTITKEGVKLLENTDIQSVRHVSDNEVILNVDNDGYERSIKGSHILIMTPRTPNIQQLNLNSANVTYTNKGIETNQRLQTTQKHIWAIGDVTQTTNQSTATAQHHANIVTKNICLKEKATTRSDLIPQILNTTPEIAQIGLSESVAKEEYGEKKINVITHELGHSDYDLIHKIDTGFIKLIAEKNGKILGLTIVAPNAKELITPWTLAIKNKINIKEINNLIAPYPSLSENHKSIARKFFFMRDIIKN